MSMRIGEALVQRGLIQERQLEQALRTQLIFGGHLGTSFLELGFVREDDLGEALAEIHGVPYARAEQLDDVPDPVIGHVPRRLAERHRVVPYEQDRRILRVAALDPRDLQAIDEIAFVTGFKVVPAVAPEIRILEALERYYGVPRPTRFLAICRDLDEKRSRPLSEPFVVDRADPPAGTSPGDARRSHGSEGPRSTAAPDIIPLARTERDEAPDAPSPEPDAPDLADDNGDLSCQIGGNATLDDYGYGKPWHEVAEEQLDREDKSKSDPDLPSEPQAPEDGSSVSGLLLEQAIHAMAQAESREDLAKALLDLDSHCDLPRILFRVRGAVAEMWEYGGLTLPEAAAHVVVPISGGSIFELLLGREYYLGPVPSGDEFREFFEALDRDVPHRIFLMPAYLDSRLAALLYLEIPDDEDPRIEAARYRTVLDALGMALELVLLKRRIHSLAEPATPREPPPA